MPAPWTSLPLLALDTETTGINPFEDRIVELAAVDVLPDGTTNNPWSTVVDPGIDIPDGAAEVHGITTDRARAEGIAPADALTQLAERIWAHIEAHRGLAAITMFKATFDWPLILTECTRHNIDIPCFAGIIDPYLVDRMVEKKRKGKRKLTLVAQHYGIELGDAAHGGLADATASGQVLWQVLARYPEIGNHSLGSLWMRQVKGHEIDRLGFQTWMRERVKPDFESVPGWPVPFWPETAKSQIPPKTSNAGAPA